MAERRPTTHGTRTTPATLDAIDATVDGRCACGCGELLAADGPSAWFVDADHQAAWAMRGTANPAQVLLGPDAADVFPNRDGDPVPLQEPTDFDALGEQLARRVAQRQEQWGRAWADALRAVEDEGRRRALASGGPERLARYEQWLAIGNAHAERELLGPPVTPLPPPSLPSTWDRDAERRIRAEEGWQSAELGFGPLSWLRWCDTCSRLTQPRTALVPLPLTAFVESPEYPMRMPEVTQHCPRCRTVWPGPPLVAQWQEDEGRQVYVLRLSAPGWGWVKHRIATDEVELAHADIVAFTWQEMERVLLDRLTFRDPCSVPHCDELARARLRVRGRVFVPAATGAAFGFADADVGVCPAHEADMWRATDGRTGLPLLDVVPVRGCG